MSPRPTFVSCLTGVLFLAVGMRSVAANAAPADPAAGGPIEERIADRLAKLAGDPPGARGLYAKGLVCTGTFKPAKAAALLSKAAVFKGKEVPITVRFSDGSGLPGVADNDPAAAPHGLAIRFALTGGASMDLLANSHSGFAVGTPADLLALLDAQVATKPDSPHPTPFEAFLTSHPAAATYFKTPEPAPESFANLSFYGNDALTFVDKHDRKQVGRYQVIPLAGPKPLSEKQAQEKGPDYLFEELRERLAKSPIRFRLSVQIAQAGDVTSDATSVWPEDRGQVDLGFITIKSAVAENDKDKIEAALAFDPLNLTPGIEASDDPLLALRSKVYAVSAKRRGK